MTTTRTKYVSLTERQAWEEHKKGTRLFFGDGYENQFQVEGAGELIGIDWSGSIPFRANVAGCETEWFCCCWKEAVQPLKLFGLAWENRNEQE